MHEFGRMGVIDLFSGSGGLSLGFKRAGFKITAAVELNPQAAETYRKNFHRTRVFEQNITSIKGSKLLDNAASQGVHETIVIGGPPCQPYSVANKQNNGDDHPYASSVTHYSRLVREIRPSAFLFENVVSFRHLEGWDRFLEDFRRAGYKVSFTGLRSSQFGIPQDRYRLFVTGFLNGHGFDISTLTVNGNGHYLSVKDAIWGLPELPESGGGQTRIPHPRKAKSQYSRMLMGNTARLYNHWATTHSEEVVKTISCIRQGKSLLDMWQELPRSVRSRFKNKDALHTNIYKRLSWRKISPTIVHVRRAMLLHPVEDRIISVREAARLQSFPDAFRFYGGWDREYQQVADAVPPLLSAHIAKCFRKVFTN